MDKKASSITGIDLKTKTNANLVPVLAKVMKQTLIKRTFLTHTYVEQTTSGRGPIRVQRIISTVDEKRKTKLVCKQKKSRNLNSNKSLKTLSLSLSC